MLFLLKNYFFSSLRCSSDNKLNLDLVALQFLILLFATSSSTTQHKMSSTEVSSTTPDFTPDDTCKQCEPGFPSAQCIHAPYTSTRREEKILNIPTNCDQSFLVSSSTRTCFGIYQRQECTIHIGQVLWECSCPLSATAEFLLKTITEDSDLLQDYTALSEQLDSPEQYIMPINFAGFCNHCFSLDHCNCE